MAAYAEFEHRSGLGPADPLVRALEPAVSTAQRFEFAVAYAKSSGVGRLLAMELPRRSRAVVGLGFGLTDPSAVEQLDREGVSVRCVVDDDASEASRFHPKLYLSSHRGELVVHSGSANLTGGGLDGNVEQHEELRFSEPSERADAQRERFETVWDRGVDFSDLRRSGDWLDYRRRAEQRRRLEAEDRRRLLHLDASTGRLIGRLARQATTQVAPGYLAITHPDWWALQLHLRGEADRALFWRRNTKRFRALVQGGLFFHLVPAGRGPEELRAVEGFSKYPGVFETGTSAQLWRRYGTLLGVTSVAEIADRLEVPAGAEIGVIHLEALTELDRPVTLEEARANGIPFARNIVSGKSLKLGQLATLLQLGGYGADQVGDVIPRAADEPGRYDTGG